MRIRDWSSDVCSSDLDCGHDASDRPLDLRERASVGIGLNALLAVLAVDICRIGGDGSLDLVGRHQPLGDAGERAAFQLVALDRAAVGATALAVMAGAAVAVVDDDGVGKIGSASCRERVCQYV